MFILIFVRVLIIRWGFVHTNTIVFKKCRELYMECCNHYWNKDHYWNVVATMESYRNRVYKCIYMPVVTYCHLSWQCLWVYLRQTCWYTTQYSAWAGQWIYPNLYSGLHCDRRERKFRSRWAAFPLNMCGLYLKNYIHINLKCWCEIWYCVQFFLNRPFISRCDTIYMW